MNEETLKKVLGEVHVRIQKVEKVLGLPMGKMVFDEVPESDPIDLWHISAQTGAGVIYLLRNAYTTLDGKPNWWTTDPHEAGQFEGEETDSLLANRQKDFPLLHLKKEKVKGF